MCLLERCPVLLLAPALLIPGIACAPPRAPSMAPPHAAAPPPRRGTLVATARPALPVRQPAPAPPTVIPPASRPVTVPERPVRCGDPHHGRRLALTFDDGPGARFTGLVLDLLQRHGVRATFFVVGRLAERHPELLRRMHADGHLVANHSWDHPRRATIAQWRLQITRTEQAIRAAGVPPAPFFRPPHGKTSPELLRLCHELGYTVVLYTLLAPDWRRPGVETLARQVSSRVAPGGIVVLHDAGGNRRQTVAALPAIIRGLRGRGFQLLTLDTLLGPRPRPVRCAWPYRPLPPRQPSIAVTE